MTNFNPGDLLRPRRRDCIKNLNDLCQNNIVQVAVTLYGFCEMNERCSAPNYSTKSYLLTGEPIFLVIGVAEIYLQVFVIDHQRICWVGSDLVEKF